AALASDRQTARKLYEQAYEQASGPVRQARLALSAGVLALAERDAAALRHWLEKAEQLARAHSLPEVLWRAPDARGQAPAEIEADDDAARTCFEQAIEVTEFQVRGLRRGTDAAVYHLHRTGLLRLLLRGACRRGDAAAAFHFQELDRGRLLLELYRAAERRLGS